MYISKRWIFALWILGIADWGITALVLSRGGQELNPLLVGWVEGPAGFVVKVLVTGAILALVARFTWNWSPTRVATIFATVVYMFVVALGLANLTIILING